MDTHQVDVALGAGRQAAERARLAGARLLVLAGAGAGMALATLVLARGLGLERSKGLAPGHGIGRPGWIDAATAAAVEVALTRHARHAGDVYEVLRRLGGLPHAALAGAAVAAAQMGLPVMASDATARLALTVAGRLNPLAAAWLVAASDRLLGGIQAGAVEVVEGDRVCRTGIDGTLQVVEVVGVAGQLGLELVVDDEGAHRKGGAAAAADAVVAVQFDADGAGRAGWGLQTN